MEFWNAIKVIILSLVALGVAVAIWFAWWLWHQVRSLKLNKSNM